MEIVVKGLESSYEIEHLTRVFYARAPLRMSSSTRGDIVYARAGRRALVAAVRQNGKIKLQTKQRMGREKDSKALSQMLYGLLKEVTQMHPPWGMLTGVRPVRLLRRTEQTLGVSQAERLFSQEYDVSLPKYRLAQEINKRQQPVLQGAGNRSYSLYVSIPFCPTRCSYCSFVSRTIQNEAGLIEPYLQKLELELAFTADLAKQNNLKLETIYIGGGTPTAISARQLKKLLAAIHRYYDVSNVKEFTVEAGRPDCTDLEKLSVLKEFGVGRISINPQTMDDAVLRAIGRKHTAADIVRCFNEARSAGHDNINMDLIAGLPKDTMQSFGDTLRQIMQLKPENVTVHTLTLKRASNMVVDDKTASSAPGQMVAISEAVLRENGYLPYYLYRQKNTVDNLENTGWTLPGKEGLYNIHIMEEQHTILSVGAGSTTKLVKMDEAGNTRMKREFNYKYPTEYINGFDQILLKKQGVMDFYASNMDT